MSSTYSELTPLADSIEPNVPANCLAESSVNPNAPAVSLAHLFITSEELPKTTSITFCTSSKEDAVEIAPLAKFNS